MKYVVQVDTTEWCTLQYTIEADSETELETKAKALADADGYRAVNVQIMYTC